MSSSMRRWWCGVTFGIRGGSNFTPETQAKLEQMARETGRPSDEFVEDAVVDLFSDLALTRETLERRVADLAADRMVDQIEAAVQRLVHFPQSGHRRDDIACDKLRFANAGEYLIAYLPETKPLSNVHLGRFAAE